METTSPSQTQQGGLLPALPNSTAVLVLGILSIVFCWCWIVGLPLGIVALALATKAEKLFRLGPSNYHEGSYKNMKAGKVCAIVGTSLSGLYFVVAMIYWAILGTAFWSIFSNFPWQNFK